MIYISFFWHFLASLIVLQKEISLMFRTQCQLINSMILKINYHDHLHTVIKKLVLKMNTHTSLRCTFLTNNLKKMYESDMI